MKIKNWFGIMFIAAVICFILRNAALPECLMPWAQIAGYEAGREFGDANDGIVVFFCSFIVFAVSVLSFILVALLVVSMCVAFLCWSFDIPLPDSRKRHD